MINKKKIVGMTASRSTEDEDYLEILANTKEEEGEEKTEEKKPKKEKKKKKKTLLYIIDARPKANAVGNKFKGAGYENAGKKGNYVSSVLEFVNIANIHSMRSSIQTLQRFCLEKGDYDDPTWYSNLDSSGWFDYLSKVLAGSVRVANLLLQGSPTLVHCSDG